MASVNAPLNANPALPEERAKQHLPSKSYADAVEEEAPKEISNGVNGTNGTNAANGTNRASTIGSNDVKGGHQASVLRIVDTGASPVEEKKEDKDIMEETRPQYERQESQHEYSATGLDESPKSPPKYKHRKTPSQKSNVSSDSQEKPSTADKTLKTNGSKDAKERNVPDDNENTKVFKKVEDEENGKMITSVKPVKGFGRTPRTDKDTELVSGRKAGQRWHSSGIRFAPLNVPLQRRLQTLAVLFHTLCIAICVSSFFFLCAIPLFWPLLIPYIIYCMTSKASTSGTLSHRSDFLRGLSFWSLFASYFPARLHRTQELPPTRKYIFGYHPHGIISMGAFAAFATEALGFSQLFPGIRNTLLTLDSNFRIPIYRDYALAMGLASVSKESCENLLSKGGPNKEGMGRAITIVIGGARESLDAQPYSLRLVLKRRKGFVKMAIRTGADLVPVLAFGENDIYEQVNAVSHPAIHKFQLLVKKLLGFTIPLFHARGVFNYDVGLMPYRRPINIICGRPVKVAQAANPKQEDIDRVHEEYIAELERLWNTWKDEFAPQRQSELEFVE